MATNWGISSLARWNNPGVVKFENHVAANALYFLHDSFARIHGTLRVTPAMAAGIASRAWSLEKMSGYATRRLRHARVNESGVE